MARTFTIEGQKYRTHPAADRYPMMAVAELRELAEDMTLFGQNFPIILTGDGYVLDGRNRLAACEIAELEPWTEMWNREDDDVSPTAWVRSSNSRRRHLNDSQLAMIAAAEEERIAKELRQLRKDGKVRPGADRPIEQAAKEQGTSVRSVERAKSVMKRAKPEIVKEVLAGKKTLKQVERELKRAEQVEQARAYVPPAGEYPVVVIDPPWQYSDELDGSDAARGGTPYPSMSIGAIAELVLPLAADAAVFLWVTNSHLIDHTAYGFVAQRWEQKYGLEAKGIATWEKDRLGLGRYFRNKTEHLVLLVRGKPVFTEEKPWSHFRAPVGEHSEKPEAAYLAIEKFCASTSRLEMFARAERKGWVTTGSELATAPKLPLEKSLGRPLAEALYKGGITGAKKARRLRVEDVPPEPGAAA